MGPPCWPILCLKQTLHATWVVKLLYVVWSQKPVTKRRRSGREGADTSAGNHGIEIVAAPGAVLTCSRGWKTCNWLWLSMSCNFTSSLLPMMSLKLPIFARHHQLQLKVPDTGNTHVNCCGCLLVFLDGGQVLLGQPRLPYQAQRSSRTSLAGQSAT